jgi:hypothetical protein
LAFIYYQFNVRPIIALKLAKNQLALVGDFESPNPGDLGEEGLVIFGWNEVAIQVKVYV